MADDMTDKMNETLEFNRSKISPNSEKDFSAMGMPLNPRAALEKAMSWDNSWSDDLKACDQYQKDCADIERLQEQLEALLPDGRVKVFQENSLLKSQLANCHKEIRRLRDELLRYSAGCDPFSIRGKPQ